MLYPSALIRGVLMERTASVLADVRLDDGQIVAAYCPNMTKMTGVAAEGCDVWMSFDDGSYRRIRYTIELVDVNGTLVGVNTDSRAALVAEAINDGVFDSLSGYGAVTPSPSPSVCDLDLTDAVLPPCRIAVLPAYEKKATGLLFPDDVDTANRLVLRELEQCLDAGCRAVSVVLAQRGDCLAVRAAWTADPVFVGALKNLCDKGLEIIACGCSVSLDEIRVTVLLPFMF